MSYVIKIVVVSAIFCLFLIVILGSTAEQKPSGGIVTLAEDASSYTLTNGIVTAIINKHSGDLISLKYKDLEMVGGVSGHAHGYWSHTPGKDSQVKDVVTINPASNAGERAEVSVKAISGGAPVGNGPGGSMIADIEIRYALGRGDSGIYTYSIFEHKPEYPATSLGEARFAAKLTPSIFDFMTVDANRRKVMPRPEDWAKGTQLNMKEVRRLNTGIYKGEVEHKYDYSAVQFDTPAWGWSSTEHHVGLWFVNPSIEYLSGGATKVELTAHLDGSDANTGEDSGGAPTVLNYWRGSHYGGSSRVVAQGESWTKVIGPFLIYCNSAPNHDEMWKDALSKAAKETSAWPFDWVNGVSYPHKNERGSVSGKLVLNDPQAPDIKMTNLLVGLSAPDYTVRDQKGSEQIVDWQQDAKNYEFWTRGDQSGNFEISAVRPGKYTLHAIAKGVLGEFAKTDITVEPGKPLNLGSLKWQPVRYGRQVWEIGIPNRTAEEFRHGDHYWQWGLYNDYPKEFPNDVNFIIGKSDWRRDWNYVQPPRIDGTKVTPTTWAITFDLPKAAQGKAILRLAIAGSRVSHGIEVTVNDKSAGNTGPLPDTGVMHRDGIRGYWVERDVTFDAALLKPGTNVIKLHVPSNNWVNGVLYDYLRLELDESAKSPVQ
jgi:rhamnogalacturonan endolyase